ncbi:hypothetical protein Vretifemale_5625, partial [Volvox reticuliferus]
RASLTAGPAAAIPLCRASPYALPPDVPAAAACAPSADPSRAPAPAATDVADATRFDPKEPSASPASPACFSAQPLSSTSCSKRARLPVTSCTRPPPAVARSITRATMPAQLG